MKTKTQQRIYTVVGLYHDNRQAWCSHVEAESAKDAVSVAHIEMAEGNDGVGGAVLSVFEGRHKDLYGKEATK